MTPPNKTSSLDTASELPVKDTAHAIAEWVSKVSTDVDALWELSVTKCKESPSGFNIAVSYIKKAASVAYYTAHTHRKYTLPLIDRMLEEGILIALDKRNDTDIPGVDNRRKLLNWYRKLSLKEKQSLPIFGNKVSLKRIPAEQRPISNFDLLSRPVKDAWEGIHQDLQKLGVVKADYLSVLERKELLEQNRVDDKETKLDRFTRLAAQKLNVVADFLEPTISQPFIQVEQLFAAQSKTVSSSSGRSNYSNACNLFIEFLSDKYGTTPLFITHVFDEHLLSRYRKYLEQKIISQKISSHHANSVFSSVRKTLHRLTQVRDLGYSFYDVNGFDASRETDTKKPFSKKERTQILEAIEKGIEDSRRIMRPYEKTGLGENPFNEHGEWIRGKSTLDNARWLFENILLCRPVYNHTAQTTAEKSFLRTIRFLDKGLPEVYEEWSIPPLATVDVLTPYLLRLAQVTGMNADPLLSLDIDDYVESHPATSRPCLRYWKERSDGHKEYHLDLFNAELNWLTSSQARVIKNIFDEVIQLTSSFRHHIEDETLKNRLFIYQSDSVKFHGRVSPLQGDDGKNKKALGSSLSRFVEKYGLTNDNAEPLTLTISRFRPTFVSEMLDNGVSLREIQLMLGHSSISTTIGYLDSLDFNSISRKKLHDKLSEIHQSTLTEVAEPQNTEVKNDIEVIFQTPLAGCKNIFDPPDFVKNLSSYVPGTACAQYNKCLSCDNVIITAKNLPEIFAMQRDYILLTDHTRVMDTPYGYVIRDNLELIKGIVDPELSDFSAEELETGQRLSEYVETTILVDGVVA